MGLRLYYRTGFSLSQSPEYMVRRSTGEFIIFREDGSELHFAQSSTAGCTYCMDGAFNGTLRLSADVDASGRAIQVDFASPGNLLALTDDLGNAISVSNSASCAGKAGALSYRMGLTGVAAEYITYSYDSTCKTLKKVVPSNYVAAPGKTAQLRSYDYQNLPNSTIAALLTTIRNEFGDPVVTFGYGATSGEATTLVDSSSSVTVGISAPGQDSIASVYGNALTSTTTFNRGAGWKASVTKISSPGGALPPGPASASWANGKYLTCTTDGLGNARQFVRDSFGRVTDLADAQVDSTKIARTNPTFVCGAKSIAPDSAPRRTRFSYGTIRPIVSGVGLSLSIPDKIWSRSVFASTLSGSSPGLATYESAELADYDPARKAGDPVDYSCGPAGTPVGRLLCRSVKEGYTTDSAGLVVAQRIATLFTYDGRGRLLRTIGPLVLGSSPTVVVGPVEERTYWPDADSDDARHGRLHEIKNWVSGWPSPTTYLTTSFELYDAFGPTRTVSPAGGISVRTRVGGAGRVTRTDAPDGGNTRVRFYDGASPRLVLLSSGSVRRFTYDGKGRVTAIEALSGDPDAAANFDVGWTEMRSYDSAGNETLVTRLDASRALVWKRQRTHDNAHQPISELHPELADAKASWALDTDDYLSSFTDEEGRVTSVTPDLLRRPSVVKRSGKARDGTSIALNVATYTYEPDASQVKSVTDASSRKTSYVHDDFGNLLTVQPDAATASGKFAFSYDARGNILERRGGDSLLSFTYDDLDRITSLQAKNLTTNSVLTYSYVYDEAGQGGLLSKVVEPDRTTTFGYDAVGRVTSEATVEGSVSDKLTTTYGYDSDGQLKEVGSPGGLNVEYIRDPATKSITEVRQYALDPATNIRTTGTKYASGIKHLPAGPITELTYSNGSTLVQGFNRRYEPIAVSSGPFAVSYTTSPAGDVNAIGAATLGYDFMGRLAEMTPSHGQGTSSYKYINSGDKVTEAWTIEAAPRKVFSYSYDLNNNLAAVTTWSAAGVATGTICLVHDALNRLTAVGPATAVPASGAAACKSDADMNTDALSVAATVRFRYDSRNRRVARQDGGGTWKHWAHLPDGSPVAELLRPATSTAHWVGLREYVWLEGRPLAQVEYPAPGMAGDVYSVHVDHLGLPRALTSATNALVWSAIPTRPYGDVAETPFSDPANGRMVVTNLRLPGQYDERLLAGMGIQGPYYNWNRWYLPTLGRFMELDPIAMGGGFNGPYGPNWYGYAEGNPLTSIDPTGLFGFDDIPNVPQPVVDATAGFGDSLSFGLSAYARNASGAGGLVNRCSKSYVGGEVASFFLGMARVAYGGLARALPHLVRAGSTELERALAASALRNTMKRGFRLNPWSSYRVYSEAEVIEKYHGVASEIMAGATRTDPVLNAMGAAAATGAALNRSECGCR
jgi:RHS repeat-associated protein